MATSNGSVSKAMRFGHLLGGGRRHESRSFFFCVGSWGLLVMHLREDEMALEPKCEGIWRVVK